MVGQNGCADRRFDRTIYWCVVVFELAQYTMLKLSVVRDFGTYFGLSYAPDSLINS
jgi:hypothetical protein